MMLDGLGVQSMQRLAIGDVGGNVVVALWPAELKEQATYLYGQRLGRPMIAAACELGWTAKPSPHLAFRNASPPLRLYMAPPLDAAEYARRWEEGDLEQVGAHSRADVRPRPVAMAENPRLCERRRRPRLGGVVGDALRKPPGVPAVGASAQAGVAQGRTCVPAPGFRARGGDPGRCRCDPRRSARAAATRNAVVRGTLVSRGHPWSLVAPLFVSQRRGRACPRSRVSRAFRSFRSVASDLTCSTT